MQPEECLREANICFPDSGNVSLDLLIFLSMRFMATHSHADYEDAMSIVDGSFTDPWAVKFASSLAVALARSRFDFFGNPEYLEEAIFRVRSHLRMMSSEDPEHQEMTLRLEELEKARFDESSVAGNSRAGDDAGDTEVNNHPSSSRVVPPLPIARPDIGRGGTTREDDGWLLTSVSPASSAARELPATGNASKRAFSRISSVRVIVA